MTRKVDFIVIGTQKGGTTALFDYLSEQPSIGLSDVKEVHHFDNETLSWETSNAELYHSAFRETDWSLVVGEATPIYCYWPNSLERIRAYRPDMKLIFMLRDPVERAWSHWKMEYARGAEKNPFSWCIHEGRQRLQHAAPQGFHREFSYVERGFYGQQVSRLFQLFAPAQVQFIMADDLRRDPNGVLEQVHRFLGAPPPTHVRSREVHVGREMNYRSRLTPEDVGHLRNIFAADQARLRALTGLSFS